ncbi:MAG: hypothetical protein U0R52_08595 [Solirubrobacterales bacterium]
MWRVRTAGAESGQASVELIGAIPALLVGAAIVVQLALAGHALWSAGLAARAGARAAAVGRDPGRAARRALPAPLREGARITGGDPVAVAVRVPWVLPGPAGLLVRARFGLGGGGG